MESTWKTQQEKIRSIPGIEIVLSARDEWGTYFREMRAFLGNESECTPPVMPLTDINALALQYPRASAFVDALEFSEGPNEARVTAGERAMIRIIDGEDPEKVIQDMVVEWKSLSGLAPT